MAEEKEMPRTMKVVDRRKFTAEGEPRDDASLDAASAPEETEAMGNGGTDVPRRDTPDIPPTPADSSPDDARSAVETSPDFVELVVTLAQQAELLLVGAEGFPAQPDQARRMIDYLAALESKTTGNLSQDEKQVLSNTVFQLRTMFVQNRK